MLDRIRQPFFVSRDVIAIYLEKLKYAPEDFYKMKRSAWSKRSGFGRARTSLKAPARCLKRVGSTLARVLSSEEARNSLSELELAEVLNVKVERIPEVLEVFRRTGDDR